jgi:chaperonin GroEL
MLQDIAILTGGQVISETVGLKLENAGLELLGRARKVTISKDETTIVEGAGAEDDIKGRINQIKAEVENTDSDYDREKLQERLAKLTGGVAIIRAGAMTEADMKQKKQRIEDALNATRAAVEEGIVAGGGVALLRASKVLDTVKGKGDRQFGVEIVRRACQAPMSQIAENAGEDGSVVVDEAGSRKPNEGYDALTGQWVDMFKAGIVDPTKVVRCALQNAASIAGLMLTTNTMITSIKDDQKAVEGSIR